MTTDAGSQRKRFFKDATVAEATQQPGGFRVLLDERTLRTPAKRELAVPSRALAEAIAEEWRAQAATIDPSALPLTRIVNSAIDGVTGREFEVRTDILAYGQSDLLCYLADGPGELVDRQSRQWGEIHAWAGKALGVELELAVGVVPVEQSPDQLAILDRALGTRNPIALAGIHVVTTLTGSLLLVLALLYGRIGPDQAWALAHLDEDFQIERWGQDEEAAGRRERRWREMRAAARVLTLVND